MKYLTNTQKAFGSITLALMLFSTTGNAALVQFDIYAKANSSTSGNGLNTGLTYSTGDTITGAVHAGDLWNAGPLKRWSNADGLVVDLFAAAGDDSGYAAGTHIGEPFTNHTQNGLTAPFGSLVGEINSTFFLLGTSFAVSAPDSGILSLYYWDSNSHDNTEFVTVSIDNNVSAVPIPAAAFMFAPALLGFMGLRRKAKNTVA